MTQGFYVSPEQLMHDRAEFARKGINRGHAVVCVSCLDGILLLAHNPSATLHKVAELHDRIGFAAVGKYHEFNSLRIEGIRWADLRAYQFSRTDVQGRAIANMFAQTLASYFTAAAKPLEVELIVAELAAEQGNDRLFTIRYDGALSDDPRLAVIGAHAGEIKSALLDRLGSGLTAREAAHIVISVLKTHISAPQSFEIALLNRAQARAAARPALPGVDPGRSYRSFQRWPMRAAEEEN